ncbi:unnamed protein product, partial [Vitis vinifera]
MLGKCKELQQLNLFNNKLVGGIPEAICNLSKLEELYLGNNQLIGEIPKKMNHLQNLKVLSFPMNNLTGSIPATIFNISSLLNISQCIQLQVISLAYNDFTGSIPSGIDNLVELQRLSLQNNSFTALLFAEIFNVSSLQVIAFTDNSLSGSLPKDICKHLPNLQGLSLSQNHLSGQLPTTLSLCGELLFLSLSFNKFRGSIPKEIGNLSKLEEIYLGTNSLIGSIPTSFGNLKALKFLNLGINNLTGTVPEAIFNISKLQSLAMVKNHLSGSLPSSIGTWLPDLEGLFIAGNEFSGIIPMSISNMSKLTVLGLSANSFTGNVGFLTSLTNCKFLKNLWIGNIPFKGTLPNSLGNLPIALESFIASACQFRGTIPTGIGNLTNLIRLDLGANDLTGSIPTTLGQLQKLQWLYIAGNRIRGSIPNDLYLLALQELFLDSNVLAFNIPTSLWSLRDLLALNLSSNFLTGNLPPEVGNMKSITTLDLSKNLVSGYIPSKMGKLQSLITLSLSQNRLQGPIPIEFGDLVSLESLDLSQNNLSGTIPKSLEALIYLKYLNVSLNKLQGEIPNGGPFINFTAESFIRDNMEIPTPIDSWLPGTHEKISHQQLLYATNDFGEDNLIGKGSQGMVYKGVLSNGLTVAIKVFNLEFQGALRSFDSECEVMQGIRHRNLVRIITCCSNLDFKALVLEYMPNGSLEKWLYSHNYFLDLIQRLNIMIDVASALEYLHHDCSSLVVHCDLKPNNVLLDDDMVAHVADFGITKLLTKTESMQQTKTLGTIGYMAPAEHGSDGIVSTKSDVYSYGILLMEVFSRKKPMDEMFTGGLTLKTWVDCLSSIMALALACTTNSPEKRLNMKDAVVELKKSKMKLLMEKRLEKLGFEDLIFYLKDGSLCRPCYSFFGFFFFFFSATSFYLRTSLQIHPHLSPFSLHYYYFYFFY